MSVVTITFGDSGENHVGNQQIGVKVQTGQGFNYNDFSVRVFKISSKLSLYFLSK